MQKVFYSNTLRIPIAVKAEIIYVPRCSIFIVQVGSCFLLRYHFSSIYHRDDNNVMTSLKYSLIFSENALTWKRKKGDFHMVIDSSIFSVIWVILYV